MLSTQPPRPARLEICPPARSSRVATRRSWWLRLQAWLHGGWPDPAPAAGTPAGLDGARHDFLAATADLHGDAADELIARIHAARTLRELWHLRTDMFSLVSLQHRQFEADRRLAELNRHFPTRSPRSGFGELEPPNMWP